MDEGAPAPEPEDAAVVAEVQPARHRLVAQSPQHAPIPRSTLCRHSPKVGAQCGNSARWDLCGGRGAISVPTAIAVQDRLAAQLRTQAEASAGQLPKPLQQPFVDAFARAARGGIEVGAGQAGQIQLPAGIPPALAEQMRALAVHVFDSAYVIAMRPTVGIGVAVLLVAAVSALFLERSWRREAATIIAA